MSSKDNHLGRCLIIIHCHCVKSFFLLQLLCTLGQVQTKLVYVENLFHNRKPTPVTVAFAQRLKHGWLMHCRKPGRCGVLGKGGVLQHPMKYQLNLNLLTCNVPRMTMPRMWKRLYVLASEPCWHLFLPLTLILPATDRSAG